MQGGKHGNSLFQWSDHNVEGGEAKYRVFQKSVPEVSIYPKVDTKAAERESNAGGDSPNKVEDAEGAEAAE